MNAKLLRESVPDALTQAGNRWKGILARPGKGSSGNYSEEVLREYGPKALAPGAKAFVDHNPERSVRDMIGTYPNGAVYEDGVGLVGELDIFPHWKEFVEAVAPHAGLSIYMMGETDAEGNVTALLEDKQNGVDLVSYPGLEGSGIIEKLYESARKADSTNGTSPEESRKPHETVRKSHMEIQELAAKVDTLAESVNTLVSKMTTLAESLEPAETPEGPDLAAVVEAVAESELPKELRAIAIESIVNGADPAEAVKAQVTLLESVRKSLTESAPAPSLYGRVVESNEDKGFSLKKIGEKA